MRIGRYRFASPWWGIAATLLCVAVFVVAGIWQVNRGQAKKSMLTQQEVAIKSPAQPLESAMKRIQSANTSALYGKHFLVQGQYDSWHQVLLDNQVLDDNVGYRVWTPMIISEGRVILVDRGWIPMGPGGRDDVPQPTTPRGKLTVRGILSHFPQPGIRLGNAPRCDVTQWPRVLNYPTIDTIRCIYERQVIDGVLLLDADIPHGFARHWQLDVGMSPMRHYAYAVQWFAMALAVVVVFFVVNMKRIR